MKMIKKITACFLAFSVSLCSFVSATTYQIRTGDIDSYDYSISVTGDTMHLYGNTSYDASYTSRSVYITANYVGSSFTGTKHKSDSAGAANGPVSADVQVFGNNRFVSAYSSHSIDGWSYNFGSSTSPFTIY